MEGYKGAISTENNDSVLSSGFTSTSLYADVNNSKKKPKAGK